VHGGNGMATFVLVHGGWSGGWEWQSFAPLLEQAGHRVYRATLTGAGERAHLASPAVNLDTHILDVANVLFYEDLREVVLVGHSGGGMAITGVADRMPERLAHLVYVDAVVPEDGQSVLDLLGPEVAADWEERARALGEGWRLPSPFGPGSERHTHTTMNMIRQPIRLTNPVAQAVPRTYIACTENPDLPVWRAFRKVAERVRTAPGWRYRELPSRHMVHHIMPRELADLLLEFG
jgi:pimeloyl-ACP methyl ester carboxylesterase